MAGRRSVRSKTKVDYSNFGGDDDFDDDFADMTPPVSKKLKTGNENKENKKKVTASVHEKKKKERPSLDDKLYERELQAALELSMSQSQNTSCEISENNQDTPENKDNVTDNVVHNVSSTKVPDEDDIVVLDTEDKESTSDKQRSARKRKPTVIDDDDDTDVEFGDLSDESDDDDDDYEEGSDFEEFKSKKTKGKTAKQNVKKQATTPKSKQKTITDKKQKSPVKSKQKTPVAPKHKVSAVSSLKSSSTPTSCIRSPVSGTDNRKWAPPGITSVSSGKSPLGGVSLKSPSSGLRVGLSRNQKLKPLHPTLKIQH